MSKGLETLKEIKYILDAPYTSSIIKEGFEIIEKELEDYEKMLEEYDVDNYEQWYEITLKANAEYAKMKQALEIIKREMIDIVALISSENLFMYNTLKRNVDTLTQEEYELLKEVLL